MNRCIVLSSGILLAMAAHAGGGETPPRPPIEPKGFVTAAVALPARSIGATVVRAKPALAVEFRVDVANYVPRDMEPTLVLDGTPTSGPSGVLGVHEGITTLGFIVERPDRLRDGAAVALQYGPDERNRVSVPGVFQRADVRPLAPDEAKNLKLPSLDAWFETGVPAQGVPQPR